MKAFGVLLLLGLAIYTKQQTTADPVWTAAFLQNKTDCAKENGVEVADTMIIWTDPTYPANNTALKCYYKCMAIKGSIIDNGKYDQSDVVKMFARFDDHGEIKEIQDECSHVPPNSDECEYAYQIYKCIAEVPLDR